MLRDFKIYIIVGLTILSATLLISFNYWKSDTEATKKLYRKALVQIDELKETNEDNELQIKVLKDEKFELERKIEKLEYGY